MPQAKHRWTRPSCAYKCPPWYKYSSILMGCSPSTCVMLHSPCCITEPYSPTQAAHTGPPAEPGAASSSPTNSAQCCSFRPASAQLPINAATMHQAYGSRTLTPP
mmetsp:Transcript_14462/g.31355  ORF Transcript_14462/g.31355 Transcript_14462/m.31355 type:complete len:105 (-) Transcript_14462:1090-1404(-)